MFYLDTNVILSYNFETEEQHWRTVNLINNLEGRFYTSPFTILELYCVISRNIGKYKLPFPKFRRQNDKKKVKMIVEYVIRRLNLAVSSDSDEITDEIEGLGIKMFSKYFDGIKLAPKVKLRTGDVLHIAYACQMKNEGKIEYIVSLDEDFQKKKDLIENETDIKVFPIE